MNNAHTYRRRLLNAGLMISGALVVVMVLSGCGVKSAPSHPEGATYPLGYPQSSGAAPPIPAAGTPTPMSPDAPRRAARQQTQDAPVTSDPRYYNPPPPATELLAK